MTTERSYRAWKDLFGVVHADDSDWIAGTKCGHRQRLHGRKETERSASLILTDYDVTCLACIAGVDIFG